MAEYDSVNELQAPGQERYIVQYFRGINDHTRISEGYWQRMLNLSAEEHPVAMARQARKKARYVDAPVTHAFSVFSYSATANDMTLYITCADEPELPLTVTLLDHDYVIRRVETIASGYRITTQDKTNANTILNTILQGDTIPGTYTTQGTRQAMSAGAPVDGVVIDDVIVTACEGGIITYGSRIIPVAANLHSMVRMGRRIYTDNGVWLDPINEELQETKKLIECDSSSYSVVMVDAGGTEVTVADNKPSDPADGTYWYDSVRDGLYRWSEGQGEWIAIATMYIKLTLPAPTQQLLTDLSGLKDGDAVEATIERMTSSYIVHSVDNTAHTIILRGLLWPTPTPTVGVKIKRKMPVLDYICEHDNRIWGCRYGENADGEFVNEIYACAQGDPLNWYLFEGTSADSWMTSVGAPGKWTGIAECGEYLCFFKEDSVFVLSGSGPSSYRLMRYAGDGVQDGCAKSLQQIRGSLYYKSCHGIRKLVPYSYPQDVSAALGADRWDDAIAGTDGQRYYIRMTDAEGESLYIYDTETGYWTREDAPEHLRLLLRWENELMAVCATPGTLTAYVSYDGEAAAAAEPRRADYPDTPEGSAAFLLAYNAWIARKELSIAWGGMGILELILTAEASSWLDLRDKIDDKIEAGYYLTPRPFWNMDYILLRDVGRELAPPRAYIAQADHDDLTPLPDGAWVADDLPEWYGETGTMGLSLPDEKRVRIIQMRVKLSTETRMRVLISYDESGRWEEIWAINKGKTGTYRIAYTPARRNDTFRLRIEGSGPAVIYSITYQAEDGGDRNVC